MTFVSALSAMKMSTKIRSNISLRLCIPTMSFEGAWPQGANVYASFAVLAVVVVVVVAIYRLAQSR